MELTKLQNGSDIRGIAITAEDKVKNLGIEETRLIANGILNWLSNKGVPRPFKIGIGHDSRLTGPELKNAMIAVLRRQVAKCWILGWLRLRPCLWRRSLKNLPVMRGSC